MWFVACLLLGWTIARGQTTLSASVPAQYQAWADENCVPDWPICVKMMPTSVDATKVDTESLDLTTGQFMQTWWLDQTYMARNITEADGTFMCDLMYDLGDGLQYKECDLKTISILAS